jgi:phospholipase C
MYRALFVLAFLLALATVHEFTNSPRLEAQAVATDTPVPSASPTSGSSDPIRHIVIITKENRTFDNFFGTFPGADGTTQGVTSNGAAVPLLHEPDHLLIDIAHQGDSARVAMDNGRMDGFDKLPGAIQNSQDMALSQLYEPDIPNYWAYAKTFTHGRSLLFHHRRSHLSQPSGARGRQLQ